MPRRVAVAELPTRERLVREARELIRAEGLAALSMRRLAARVGVTATALYRHFPNKMELLQRLVDDANAELGAFLFAGREPRSALAGLWRIAERYRRFASEHQQAYDVLFAARERRDLDVPPRGQRSANFQRLRDCVAAAIAAGDLPPGDPADRALALWALMHGLVALDRQGRFGGDERLFRRAFDASVAQLIPATKPGGARPRS